VVADSRQKIYTTPDPIETLRGIVRGKEHRLKLQYRCGRNICKLADDLGKDSEGYSPLLLTSRYDESARPSSVEEITCRDIVGQTQRIVEKLSLQLKAYPDELLGVLCPRSEEVEKVWWSISDSPLADVAMLQMGGEHSAFHPDKRIIVGTFHSAKGVEFRALHLVSCNGNN